MNELRAGALFLCAIFAGGAGAVTTTTVVDVPSGSVTQRFLYVRPDNPIANLVDIPGGMGFYGIQDDGTMATSIYNCGPIERNRLVLAERGFSVALVDANSAGGIYDFADIQEVVRYMQARDNVPTWIVGGSNSTRVVTNMAVSLPAASRVGAIYFSPQRPTAQVASVTRPALVIGHSADPLQFSSAMFAALTGTTAKERVIFTGGSNASCGFHLFNGLDAEFVAAIAAFINANSSFATVALNFQGLWYKSPAESESGWGVNVAHQGDTLFVTWFTYDADGGQMWLVAPDVRKTGGNDYSGALFRTTGPAFDAAPFNPAMVGVTAMGTVTFSFTDTNNGTFGYTVNGFTQSKAITRQIFDTPPTCTAGGSPGSPPNFQDLWYASPAESESGWGVNITHQGNILFATWFTYDSTGRGMWIVGPRLERTTGNTFGGGLFRTTGPAFSANPWNPGNVAAASVGAATFTFASANAGTFNYTVNGITQTKNITRQVYGSPATVCR